jgi:hypothetical protein
MEPHRERPSRGRCVAALDACLLGTAHIGSGAHDGPNIFLQKRLLKVLEMLLAERETTDLIKRVSGSAGGGKVAE